MRIVMATFATERGGVWKHMMDLAEFLAGRGDEITIAVPRGAADLVEDIRRASLQHEVLDVSPSTPADVWHLHLPKPFDRRTLPLLLKARAARRRIVVTEHLPRHPSSDPSLVWESHIARGRRKPGAAAVKTLVKVLESRAAHQVITVSESSRDFMIHRFKLRPSRCVAIRNGVLYSPASPLPDLADGLRVLAIGTVSSRKGHDLLIEAAAHAQQPWTVDVYGTSSELDTYRDRAAVTGGRVCFRGWTDDVARHVDAHHLLVMPSRYEPLGYAAVEAMIRGRPVVASAVDGLLEVVVDGVTGRLLPAGDACALAQALDDAATSPATLARWASAAHDRAREQFSLRSMAEEIRSVYRGDGRRGGRQRTD